MGKTAPQKNHRKPLNTTQDFGWRVFFWACAVFIVYGSLFPFNFQVEPKPIAQFYAQWHPFKNTSDAIDNFLLFVPLGVALDACFGGRKMRFWAGLTALLLLGVGIQLLQLYLPSRTAAASDVLWNGIGMVLGMVAFKRVRLAIDRLQHLSAGQHDRYAMLLVAVWFCYESFPFVPTLDVGLLREHLKTAVMAPPFEVMRLGQHTLASALAGAAIWRANWLQPRWLNVLLLGGLAVFLEIFVAYGSLRRETLLGIVLGLLVGYRVTAKFSKIAPGVVLLIALGALLMTVVTPYRGQADGAAFTWTPFSYLAWWGNAKDISPTAFEALALGSLLWAGRCGTAAARPLSRLWIGAVFALLLVLEIFRVFVVGYHGDTTPLVLAVVLAAFLVSFDSRTPTLPPAEQRQRPAPTLTTTPTPGYFAHLTAFAVLAALIGIGLHLPGIPYNLRELVAPGMGGLLSVLGLAVTAYTMSNGVFLLLNSNRRQWLRWLPVVLGVHGICVWWVLWLSVPMESLGDIVGAPVLDWPWQWETLGRYVALHIALMLQMAGAIVWVRVVLQPSTLAHFLYWVLLSALLAWPTYWVVVQWAATDNLTELMSDGASFLAASALAAGLFLNFLAASALSAALNITQRRVPLIGAALLALVGATWLYWLGTEHTIVKYGKVFSTFQFLLSTDREHYAQGVALAWRYVVAQILFCSGLAALQWPAWRELLRALPVRETRRT